MHFLTPWCIDVTAGSLVKVPCEKWVMAKLDPAAPRCPRGYDLLSQTGESEPIRWCINAMDVAGTNPDMVDGMAAHQGSNM